jgi:thiol-disulfide isomerase/thioredoxin
MILLITLVCCLNAVAETATSLLWAELKMKRDNFPAVHQEIEVLSTQDNGHDRQSRQWELVLDMSRGRWREKTVSGFGEPTRLFDGATTFSFEESGTEFVKLKNHPKGSAPSAKPYDFEGLDIAKAKEVRRLPCGFEHGDHECVVLEIPLKPWMRAGSSGHVDHLIDGNAQMLVDLETGLLLSSRTVQLVQGRNCTCRSDIAYVVKRQSNYAVPDEALFALPSTHTLELKELPAWNVARIKTELVGKPAPEVGLTALDGSPITIAGFHGKTVLLDFWATWCPPCRQDAPALQKLYERYHDKDLAIIGISVSEDRKTVERFLKSHPAGYSFVLSSENELPRAYRPRAIPTYIIIDANGLVQGAAEGDQGFSELRKLLKKSGLEAE